MMDVIDLRQTHPSQARRPSVVTGNKEFVSHFRPDIRLNNSPQLYSLGHRNIKPLSFSIHSTAMRPCFDIEVGLQS